jgi:hypothetical protein
MTRMFDTLVFDAKADVRYTGDGYMTAFPRVARTGIQLYYGSELGLKGQDAKKVMKVYRSPEQVFHKDAMTSFAHRPFTDDHPPVQVTAENWKQYATGQSGAEVARDGEFIRVPMVLMDAAAIKKFKDGKVEISMGYDCEIDFTPGTTPAGEAYDAVQKNPRGNHYAVVDAARGGSKLRIGDAAGKVNASAYADGLRAIMDGKVDRGDYASFADGTISGYLADKEYPFILKDGKVSLAALRGIKVDAIVKGDADVLTAVDTMLSQIDGTTTSAVNDGQQESLTMKVITIDGVPCQVDNDQTAAVIQRALDTSATALKTSQDAFGKTAEELAAEKKKNSDSAAKHTTEIATKDAEIATLKKQVEDATLTPAKLDALVKDRAVIAGKARAILGDKLVVDGKTDTEIMGQVVTAKLGDTAKGWNGDQIKISFDTLTAGTKPVDQVTSGVHDTARSFSGPAADAASTEKLITDRDRKLSEAWKGQTAQA